MYKHDQIDLKNFMPDSLYIPANVTVPIKRINHYENFISQDPYEVLNLVGFTARPEVPEDVRGSEIQEFFRDSCVFITGGTGFLGKLLIEKSIRSLPHLKHLYLLVRPKRGKHAQERFKELMEDQVFLRMQTEVPHYLSKMTVVEGDISEPGLGLSAEDRQMLLDNVNVVFNSAADVRFTEPLESAIRSNVLGPKRIVELCKEMHNLKALVHVSTAYSHCVRHNIEEKIYNVYTDYEEVTTTLENTPESEIKHATGKIIQDWPNTYTFSKALSEQMLDKERGNLPLCIVRPSIVLPTYKEPVRGWCDNLYGPMGMAVGIGMGVLHCGSADLDASADFVPVDFVANFLLAAAWKTGSQTLNDEVTVFNFTATSVRPTCWKDLAHLLLGIKNIWPFQQAVWYTSYINTNHPHMYSLAYKVLHTLPGLILDNIAVMVGQNARLTKLYSKVDLMKDQMVYFSNKTWKWKSVNVWNLWNEMSRDDQELFGFDLASIDFKEHLLVSKLGMRYFFLKENMETLPAAVKNNNKLYWVHKAFQLTVGYAILKLMATTSHLVPI